MLYILASRRLQCVCVFEHLYMALQAVINGLEPNPTAGMSQAAVHLPGAPWKMLKMRKVRMKSDDTKAGEGQSSPVTSMAHITSLQATPG